MSDLNSDLPAAPNEDRAAPPGHEAPLEASAVGGGAAANSAPQPAPNSPAGTGGATRGQRRRTLRSARRRRHAPAIAVAGMLAVIAAAWVVILVAGGGSSSAGDAAVMGQPGAVLKLPPPSPDAAGIPVRLAIPAIGVDTEIRPYTVPDAKAGSDARTGESCYQDGAIVCVDPPEADVAYWQVGGRAGVAYGDMPGGETRGTVYIHGHAGNPAQRPVFNDLPDLKAGDTADVATAYGVFTYTVEDVRNIPKDDLPYDEEVLNQVPGRLMLITCYHGPGAETVNGSAADNTVVTLQLTGNRALDATDNPGGGA